MKEKRKEKKSLSHAQVMAFGFLSVIAVGAFLLMLPISSRDGQWTNLLDVLFTSTSATCVTGLVVQDTYQYWSLFGQIIIIILIQIGGLGVITISVCFSLILNKHIGLRTRNLIQESVSSMQLSGAVKLVLQILKRTFAIEGIGAVLLAIRFIPKFGFFRGLYFSIFHSISAFCNAGFDLMGFNEAYSSLMAWSDDVIVNITIMSLIIIGGLGFIVWEDLRVNKYHFKKYSLHTKIVMIATFVLVFGGAALYYVLERTTLFANMGTGEQILSSLFASVTTRTAGFNTTDVEAMTQGGKFLTTILMFIGGNPGSTAGGIKTTTLVVVFVYVWSNLRNNSGNNILGRRISDEEVKKACLVLGLNLGLAVCATQIISAVEMKPLEDILLEVFSAIGTVGLSAGITRSICGVSKVILILLMFCGRIGSVTFATSFAYKQKKAPVTLPIERINVG